MSKSHEHALVEDDIQIMLHCKAILGRQQNMLRDLRERREELEKN